MRINPWEAGILFFVGTVIFPISFVLQRYWWKKTKGGKATAIEFNLSDKDTVDICNKIVSSLQAICAGVSGWIICINTVHDVLHSEDDMSIIYAWFGIPYFIYDTFCMYYVFTYSLPSEQQKRNCVWKFFKFVRKSPVIFFHHMIMAPVGWTLIVFYRDKLEPGDFFVGIIYMMECSTPFVSLRFVLSKLKMKNSQTYIVNGVLMLISFPVFRILSVAYALVLYTQQNNYANVVMGFWSIPVHWQVIWVTAVAPQIYWFFLMWKGLMKIFTPSKSSTATVPAPVAEKIDLNETEDKTLGQRSNDSLPRGICHQIELTKKEKVN